MASTRGWWPIAAMVSGLAVVNVASNRLVPHFGYVPFAVVSTAALVWFALRVDGRSWDELGLARSQAPRGLRWGAVLATVVLVAYLIGFVLPWTADLFRDDRVDDWSLAQVLFAAFVRVPLGTVLLEEVAFRGVLPASLGARTRRSVAVGVSAGLFGLWHVLPSLGLERVNPVAEGALGGAPGWVTVALSVGSTALVGLWMWFLRHRSDSLMTPMVLHWSTNGLGYLFAWYAWNS